MTKEIEPTEAQIEAAARSLACSANRLVEEWQRYRATARWAVKAAFGEEG